MAGKQTAKKIRTNKAYAEGRHARYIGKSANANPWPVAFEEETTAWAFGYAAPDGELDDTCYSGFTGLPAATGRSTPTPGSLTSGPAPGILPLNKWPKPSLQHLLDSLNITYPANATVAALAALVPESHQHHIAEEIPVPSWGNARIAQWLEKEGVDIPDALRDDKDNLLEMVHDVIELKAGIPIDPGSASS